MMMMTIAKQITHNKNEFVKRRKKIIGNNILIFFQSNDLEEQ